MDSVFKHDFLLNAEIVLKDTYINPLKTMGLTMQGKKHQGKTLDSKRCICGNLR